MKLSEAIRDGARFKDVHGQTLWVGTCDGDVCGCVIGTTLYVKGEMNVGVGSMYGLMAKHFPLALKLTTQCPVPDCAGKAGAGCDYGIYKDLAGTIIEHLYEHHDWSKKAIAEWVEVQENRIEAEASAKVQHEAAHKEAVLSTL